MTSILAPFHTTCPSCTTRFEIDPDRVPDEGVHAVCSTCLRTFRVELPVELLELRPGGFPTAAPAALVEPEVRTERAGTGLGEESASFPDESVEESISFDLDVVDEEVADPLEFDVVTQEDSLRQSGPTGFERIEVELVEELPGDGDRGAPPRIEDEEEAAVDFEILDAPVDAEHEAVPEAAAEDQEVLAPPPAGIEDLSSLADEVMAEGPASSAPAPSLSEGVARFGRRDPRERARRLARVLVSDIIAYYPEKHADALRRGTVKADFEDEVRKSWKEYVDQVGAEMAEETPFFTEALNDVLAGGQQLY